VDLPAAVGLIASVVMFDISIGAATALSSENLSIVLSRLSA
jgi:hypothetical protein